MTSVIQGVLASYGISTKPPLPAGTTKSADTDLIVSYSDVWRWDIVMYLKSLQINFVDGPSGTILATGRWENSAFHGFQDHAAVTRGVIAEMFTKMKVGQNLTSPLLSTSSEPVSQPSAGGTSGKTGVFSPGVRLTFLDKDARSGAVLGESTFFVSESSPTQVVFNDGAFIVGPDGTPIKGNMHASFIYGASSAHLSNSGGTWKARFRAAGTDDIPVQLTLLGSETRVISGRQLAVARISVSGFGPIGGGPGYQPGSASSASIKGEMLVDLSSGLVVYVDTSSRSPLYSLHREVTRVAGP